MAIVFLACTSTPMKASSTQQKTIVDKIIDNSQSFYFIDVEKYPSSHKTLAATSSFGASTKILGLPCKDLKECIGF